MAAAAERDVDVLVIGLGPGGASAALTAARAGGRVLGVDRNQRIGEPVQCAEFVPRPMGGYARDEGVLRQTIDGMKTVLPSGTVEHSAFPGLMIDRAAFDRAIAERAADAGATLETGTRLVALDRAERTATLRGSDGEETTVRFGAIIGADGPRSPSAALAGLPELRTVQTRQYTVPLLKPYTDTDVWLSDDFPGGYAWLFPRGDMANLGLGIDKRVDRDLKAPLDGLHAQLVEQGLVGETILGRTGGAIPVGGLRERLYVDGPLLLVGDAAGLTHPITGAGISAAVVSGELAGRAAMGWLQGDPEALDDFEEDVRDQFEASVQRGVQRRLELDRLWRTPAAHDDAAMRRGWIAFNDYFAA